MPQTTIHGNDLSRVCECSTKHQPCTDHCSLFQVALLQIDRDYRGRQCWSEGRAHTDQQTSQRSFAKRAQAHINESSGPQTSQRGGSRWLGEAVDIAYQLL